MIAIVKSSFNSKITDGLYKGCVAALNQNGFSDGKIEKATLSRFSLTFFSFL